MAPGTSTAGQAPAEKGVEPEVEELRVAMALNGGVSLAVWMGGCAVELDRARRAHKDVPAEHGRVYDSLCECFGRRLVIDILTGTSAGGINGALLGAAIAKGGRLEPDFVRDKWLELGDLSRLLQDQGKEDPTALMKGDDFHRDIEAAFEDLLKTGPGPVGNGALPGIVPSLDVTMTDVIGVEKRFRDAWGGELIAREHRPRFKFREPAHFTAEALAAAARTSASFPVAFDPWRISGNARILAGLPNQTYGMDGGLLDNAPIGAALELIPTRTSNSRVRRYVCYLNGDPTVASEETIGAPPSLREVAGHTINLPRTAPLVDHLYAIRGAVERPHWAEMVQTKLLGMDLGELRGVALALFDAYRERRGVQSLEELFDAPGDVNAVHELLEKTGGRLPWIPANLEPPASEEWDWGVRPAQRIVHLLLDLLRPAIATADPETRRRLLATRRRLDEQLTRLGDARDHVTRHESENNPARFDEEAALERLQKAVTKAEARSTEAREAVERAAEFFRAEAARTPLLGRTVTEPLFGSCRNPGKEMAHFFQRMLAIEVVRRAFAAEADIESAEKLHFVQLTPAAPTPIFTSAPLDQQSPASVDSKLTGVGLGHFAGFYRRSWRANDFMWGRLDAAARVVDLLLDAPSNDVGVVATPGTDQLTARSECLAAALLSDHLGAEGRWLLEEGLANVAGNAGNADGEGKGVEQPAPGDAEPTTAELRERVEATIRAELKEADEGGSTLLPFTRAAFQRAAQLEIVAVELEKVATESVGDRELGSAAKPLELNDKGAADDRDPTQREEILAVRDIYGGGDSLPRRLTDPGEAVSDLGLRTLSHAALVGLSTVRTAGLPMSKVFGLVRTPVLAIAGAVAASRLYRATVAIGFWAAALYLTSRLVTATNEADLEFKTIWAPETLTALAAVLGVAGIVAVPWMRAWRKMQPLRNAIFVVGLLATAGSVAAVLALTAGNLDSVERVLFAPGSTMPPELVVLAPLAALAVVSASRLPLPGWLQKLTPLLKFFSSGKPMCVVLLLAFALIGTWAGYIAVDAIDNLWRGAAAALAVLGAPVAIFRATSLGKSRKKPA